MTRRRGGLAGWLTPTAGDAEGHEAPGQVLARRDNLGRLKEQSQLAEAGEWAMTEETDGRVYAVWMPAGWNTPSATDAKGGYQGGRMRNGKNFSAERLDQTAQLALLPEEETPAILGPVPVGSIAGTAKSARLNPEFSRWLMGFPAEWGSCGDTAMRSFRKSRPGSSKRSSKRKKGDGDDQA